LAALEAENAAIDGELVAEKTKTRALEKAKATVEAKIAALETEKVAVEGELSDERTKTKALEDSQAAV
jgi:predicted  nucleic acid-binding Zn-ribbon protein